MKLSIKKQRCCHLSIFWKEKKKFFENSDTKNITDNKQFWETNEPSFCKNVKNHDKIMLDVSCNNFK